jgi:hypothetical protein
MSDIQGGCVKLVFLRGAVPTDRDPHEIMFDSLDADTDMWTHLACALGDEACRIVYWGGLRHVKYTDSADVVWTPKLKEYVPGFIPDVIFERGGFNEGRRFTKRYPKAYRIYYGSGQRYMPKNDHVKYNLVLVDSERQLRKARKRGWNAQLWQKPASPQFRYMPEVAKEYDVCYVADGRFPFRAKIKNVDWVYETAPKDLKILHLGWSGDRRVPKNVTVKRVQRGDMPLWYNKCRILVCCYSEYDSSPRVISEAMACGLDAVVSSDVNTTQGTVRCPLDDIWHFVKVILSGSAGIPMCIPTVSVQQAADHIRDIINDAA